ncbi:hypothetical protein HZS_882 [Henneguya salminicola]|nr:hypothetical protein HZS_882 [Henneguya salminicola]
MRYDIIYDLNGAHGNNARMLIYAAVQIYPVDIKHYQRDFYIKVISIYWNKYKLINGQCCLKNTFEPCVDSCDYLIEFYISGEEIVTNDKYPGTKLTENRLHVYVVTTLDAPNSKYNISLVLRNSKNKQIIDNAFINPGEYSIVEANFGIAIKGKFGNVDMTVSFGYVCRRYTSRFCIKKCKAIFKIEYCDYETGKRHCINGAKDIHCEKKRALLCSNDICSRNGLCEVINNNIRCKCKEGYKGKYCKEFNCPNNCNGNGYCVSAKTCVCNSRYIGKLCEEYPCSETIMNPCMIGVNYKYFFNLIECIQVFMRRWLART